MMKRLLLALALCFCGGLPAFAQVAIISGTGTGGALAAPSTTASGGTTVALTTTVTVGTGNLIVVGCASNNAAQTWSRVDDSAGNTYSASLANTNTGTITVRTFHTVVTSSLASGGTITCTGNSTSSTKGVVAAAFSGNAASPLDAASVTQTGSSTTFTVGPTGTLAYPGGANGEVLFGMSGYGTAGTVTPDGNFTSLGATTTNIRANWGYKIVSANTAITYANTTSVSSSYAGNLAAFKGTGGGAAASCTRTLLGVGC